MEFNEYQKKANTTNVTLEKVIEKFPDLPEDILKTLELTYVGLGLGEAGEVQGKIKKLIRDCAGGIPQDKKEAVLDELGDLLWYMAGVCTVLGADLSEVAQNNLNKLQSRKERGVLHGSGDNR